MKGNKYVNIFMSTYYTQDTIYTGKIKDYKMH